MELPAPADRAKLRTGVRGRASVIERDLTFGVIAVYDQRRRRPDAVALDRLDEWAQRAGPLLRAASGLAASDVVPDPS